MMIEDRFFEQQWVQELSNEDFRMLLYLFKFSSKSGIVELNMRMINFIANTGRQYTKEEVLERFSNVLKLVPGRTDTAIFPEYVATNWAKGKPIDPNAPLFRGVINELSSFGLTIEKLNKISKKKILVKGDSDGVVDSVPVAGDDIQGRLSANDAQTMFDAFWSEYPSSCPRKVDKKKCREKFITILKKSKDAVQMFNQIMNGLQVWKDSDMWQKDGGQFIKAPAVWLNNANWNDKPMKGNANGNRFKATANNNVTSDCAGVF